MSGINWSQTVISMASGGLCGAIFTFVVQRLLEANKLWSLSKNIRILTERLPKGSRVRVCNYGVETIHDAIAYISINYNPKTDILEGNAFIDKNNHPVNLIEDRLCWALANKEKSSFMVSIFPGEKQALDIVKIYDDKIEIPSEQGWGRDNNTKSRVFLVRKSYNGELHIVGKNILRRNYKLTINPDHKDILVLKDEKLDGYWHFLIFKKTSRTNSAMKSLDRC